MPCYTPLKGYQSRTRSDNGKRRIVFSPSIGFSDKPMDIPCRQCIGCRLERSRQWAIRCVHEAACWEDNCFITLTYDDEHLPADMSLRLSHFQKFMKRLRKKYGQNIRFYHCGEYGETYKRPHYHACIFNFDFPDKKLWTVRDDTPLYTSESLQKLWPFGYSSIGNVTFESAAYVARYIMKKINGDQAAEHYEYVHPITGEITNRAPEYTSMSKRPGIGAFWFEKFNSEVYPLDRVVVRAREMRPPKFYDNRYEVLNPDAFQKMKANRVKNAKKHLDDNTPDRLQVKQRVKELAIKHLPRTLD